MIIAEYPDPKAALKASMELNKLDCVCRAPCWPCQLMMTMTMSSVFFEPCRISHRKPSFFKNRFFFSIDPHNSSCSFHGRVFSLSHPPPFFDAHDSPVQGDDVNFQAADYRPSPDMRKEYNFDDSPGNRGYHPGRQEHRDRQSPQASHPVLKRGHISDKNIRVLVALMISLCANNRVKVRLSHTTCAARIRKTNDKFSPPFERESDCVTSRLTDDGRNDASGNSNRMPRQAWLTASFCAESA